jgi:DNA-binding protein HU-beta
VFQTALDKQRRIVAYLNDLQAQVDKLTALQDATQGVGCAAAVGAGSGVSGGAMSGRIDRKEVVNRVSQRIGRDTDTVSEVVEATLEEIYEALKRGERVSLRNFGTFYVRPQRDAWVFKFRPSQRLRKLFGWSSSYKGEL